MGELYSNNYQVTTEQLKAFRAAIAADPNCTLAGGWVAGELDIKTPVGIVKLSYEVFDGVLTVNVVRRGIVPVASIFDRIEELMQSHIANAKEGTS